MNIDSDIFAFKYHTLVTDCIQYIKVSHTVMICLDILRFSTQYIEFQKVVDKENVIW